MKRCEPLTIDELRQRVTISPAEALPWLGCSRAHLYRSLDRGDVPGLRLGRLYRIPVRPLLRLLGLDEPHADVDEPGRDRTSGAATRMEAAP